MNDQIKLPGLFLLELVTKPDGNFCALWASDVNNPVKTKAFEFAGVEAKTIIEVLDQTYTWIDSLGYGFESSEIIVFDLQEFCILLGKQGEDSLWIRGIGDFVSYFAGNMGMSYADASSALVNPLFSLEGEVRYRKMGAILLMIRKAANGIRSFLKEAFAIEAAVTEARAILDTNGASEQIWGKSSADRLGETPPENQ